MKNMVNTKNTLKYMKLAVCMVVCVFGSIFMALSAFAESSDGHPIMVSLGDSYSAGEGIEPFYGQELEMSQKVGNPDWIAHRSQNSWPGMLKLSGDGTMADHKDEYWYFGAVSGAVTDDLFTGQEKEYNKDNGKYNGGFDLAPQLDYFNLIGENEVDYVTLTLGGNDAGFVSVIQQGALHTTYLNVNHLADQIDNSWKEYFKEGGIKDKLRDSYKAIEQRAGTQANIIVAGYPRLLDANGKGALFNLQEASMINEAVTNFNSEIEILVYECQSAGMNIYFVSVEEEFLTHEAYSSNPYINGIMLMQTEDINDNFGKSIMNALSAYSIHPNYKGACAYARCVQAKIDELETRKNAGEYLSDNKGLFLSNLSGDINQLLNVYLKQNETVIEATTVDEAGNSIFSLDQGTYTFCIDYDGLTIVSIDFDMEIGAVINAEDLLPKTIGFTKFDTQGVQTIASSDYSIDLDLLVQTSSYSVPNERLARQWNVFGNGYMEGPTSETRAAECIDYRYDVNGNLRGKYDFMTNWNTPSWEWWRTDEYNENGDNIRYSTPAYGSSNEGSVTDKTYDAQGRLLYSTNNSSSMPWNEKYEYGVDGKLVSSVSEIGYRTTHCSYDEFGNMVQATQDLTFPWFDPGQEIDYYENQYNELNQLIHVSVSREEYTNGSLTVARYPLYETTYTYYQSGIKSSIATTSYYRADNGTVTMNGNSIAYFDEEGRFLYEEYDDYISAQYSYDENGNMIGSDNSYTVYLGRYPLLSYNNYVDDEFMGTAEIIGLYWYDGYGRLIGYSEGNYGEQSDDLTTMDIVYEYAPFEGLPYTGETPALPDLVAMTW